MQEFEHEPEPLGLSKKQQREILAELSAAAKDALAGIQVVSSRENIPADDDGRAE